MTCCKEMKKKINEGTITEKFYIHAATGGPFDYDIFDDFICIFCPFCGAKLNVQKNLSYPLYRKFASEL